MVEMLGRKCDEVLDDSIKNNNYNNKVGSIKNNNNKNEIITKVGLIKKQ